MFSRSSYTAERVAQSVEKPEHILGTHLTDTGRNLVCADPGILEEAVDVARSISLPFSKSKSHAFLSSGETALTYELSSDDDLVVKVSSENTIRENWRQGTRIQPGSLFVDLRFMDVLGKYFEANPEHNFFVPKQVAALKVANSGLGNT